MYWNVLAQTSVYTPEKKKIHKDFWLSPFDCNRYGIAVPNSVKRAPELYFMR